MNQKSFYILYFMLAFSINLNSQVIQLIDSNTVVEKASYMGGDLRKLLSESIEYPVPALKDRIGGDVVFSFIVNKEGSTTNPELVGYPNHLLSVCSVASFSKLNGLWVPAKINSSPIDKKYTIVFRYRIFMDTKPYDYSDQIKRNLNNKKYEKVIKLYDRQVEDNPFDYALYESRAKVKDLAGDANGAREDRLKSKKIYNEILSVINVYTFGTTGYRVIRSETVEVRVQH